MVHRYSLKKGSELVDDEAGDLVPYVYFAELEAAAADRQKLLEARLDDERQKANALLEERQAEHDKLAGELRARIELDAADAKQIRNELLASIDETTTDARDAHRQLQAALVRVSLLEQDLESIDAIAARTIVKPPKRPIDELVEEFIAKVRAAV